jgi:hypothetical protein
LDFERVYTAVRVAVLLSFAVAAGKKTKRPAVCVAGYFQVRW